MNLAYSARNRSAAIRSDVLNQSEVEAIGVSIHLTRLASYLAFSAMLLAGLDGIQNRIMGEPLDKDIYDLSPEQLQDVPSLPGIHSSESLKALEDDRIPVEGSVLRRS